jgi:hypothetical protein
MARGYSPPESDARQERDRARIACCATPVIRGPAGLRWDRPSIRELGRPGSPGAAATGVHPRAPTCVARAASAISAIATTSFSRTKASVEGCSCGASRRRSARQFRPQVLVSQHRCDTHRLDPLAHLPAPGSAAELGAGGGVFGEVPAGQPSGDRGRAVRQAGRGAGRHRGMKQAPRTLGSAKFRPLGPAPGTYVLQR